MATCLVTADVITRPSLPLPWWRPIIAPLKNSLSRRSLATNYTRWDSNAETVRSRKFGFDSSKRIDQSDDEDDEPDDGFFKSKRKKRRWWSDEFDDGGFIEEAIDSIWVFKVFKAYGWFFPLILASWLLSSGPKAFLMALAIPLGQSVISLAFDKLWGRSKSKPKRRRRTRGQQSAATDLNPETDEVEDLREPSKGKTGYQSWVAGNKRGRGSNYKGGREETGFGGWDDLERANSASRMKDTTRMENSEKGKAKLSRELRKSDTPLLMRLLVAVFPFLGSWTKMFW